MTFGTIPPDSSGEQDFYRRIAPIYDLLVGPFLRPVRNSVRRIAGESGCRRILDIGCGTGEQANMLASDGFIAAGIDLSPAMLSKAVTGDQRAGFFLGDAEKLPFLSGSFDCILLSLVVHEMNYSTAVGVVNDALRVLAPWGKLIIYDYRRGVGLKSRLSLALLHIVERIAGKRHFMNFRYFIKLGGLDAFVAEFPLTVISSRTFLLGGTKIVVAEKQFHSEMR